MGGSLAHHGRYLEMLAGGRYESLQLRLFQRALGPGKLVVDCGAHIGLYTLLAARGVGARGNVIALEPDQTNLRALRENVDANGFSDTVEVIAAAASDRAGMVPLYPFDDQSFRLAGSLLFRSGAASTTVRSVTLDGVLGGRRIDVAKIDVEGVENLVISGATQALARSPGAVVFIECHPAALANSGASASEWLAALRGGGTLELLDERRQQLVSATDAEISRMERELAGWPFMVVWTVADPARGQDVAWAARA
jgi:FkbM family methyltransferase